MAEIIAIAPADGWYARIGNNNKRIQLACWAAIRGAGQSDCNVVGMIPANADREICPAPDDPKFKSYEYGPFDRKNRVDPVKARKALAHISELTETDIQDHVEHAKATALFAMIAEQEIDSEYPELEE